MRKSRSSIIYMWKKDTRIARPNNAVMIKKIIKEKLERSTAVLIDKIVREKLERNNEEIKIILKRRTELL